MDGWDPVVLIVDSPRGEERRSNHLVVTAEVLIFSVCWHYIRLDIRVLHFLANFDFAVAWAIKRRKSA